MSRRSDYRARLTAGEPAQALVATDSGLPGPRGNLELVAAIADVAAEDDLLIWAAISPDVVGGDEPSTVLVMGGVVGLGRLLAEGWHRADGRRDLLARLRGLATDPRWRVREGVAMAIQRWAETDPDAAFLAADAWVRDEPLVQRAAVAAVCEPRLLTDPAIAARALAVVDAVTADLARQPGRRDPDIEALRKALGYGWSVAIVAAPSLGRPAFERWLGSTDPTLRWILRENLAKARLSRLDPEWVATSRARLEP
jgi:hypothetical protein